MYVRNIGRNDKVLRFILAIILLLIVALFDFNLALRWALGIVGVILFITAFVNWCPLYSILGHSSRGQGLDKITQRDIQEAVKDFSLKATPNRVEVDITPQSPKKKAKTPTATKKKAPAKKKTVVKKTTAAKKTTSKTATKKVTKKAPVKKKAVTKKKATAAKKTTSKTATKKAPAKKKTVVKKTTKKKTTPKKSKK